MPAIVEDVVSSSDDGPVPVTAEYRVEADQRQLFLEPFTGMVL